MPLDLDGRAHYNAPSLGEEGPKIGIRQHATRASVRIAIPDPDPCLFGCAYGDVYSEGLDIPRRAEIGLSHFEGGGPPIGGRVYHFRAPAPLGISPMEANDRNLPFSRTGTSGGLVGK